MPNGIERGTTSLVAKVILLIAAFSLGMSEAQQNSPIIPGSLDQTSTIAARRVSIPSGNQAPVTAAPEDFSKVTIGPGYLLQMEIYDTPEMSIALRVDSHGFITVPLVGPLRVEGDTLSEAQVLIAAALVSNEILKAPQVSLNILQFSIQNVTVLGEVQSPGRIQVLAPRGLDDILGLVGGETIAAGKDIEIQHHGDGEPTATRHVNYAQGSSPEFIRTVLVYPGDTVFVHRAGAIYVLGAVARPGGYLMVNGGSLSVTQAISLAGGTTLQASAKTISIIRTQGVHVEEIEISFDRMARGAIPPAQLQLNDVVFVPTSGWKTAFLNGSSLLSATASAAIYRAP